MISCIARALDSSWLIQWILVIRVNMRLIARLCEVRSANIRQTVPSPPLLGSLPQRHCTYDPSSMLQLPPPALLVDPKNV